ncbi:FAD-dependent oxidoreductase [Patescibacteria group bacterium]|nr:FAD-dependent oxidoreductase [Patescibacteria group bacterium]
MFASLELIKKNPTLKIALLDMGSRIENRNENDVMTGFGGAGTYSDGKLHFTPKLSHERTFHLIQPEYYQQILNEIDETFMSFGVTTEEYPKNRYDVEMMIEEAQKQNIELIVRRTKHVGTDNLKNVMKNFQDYLENNGVILKENTEVEELILENSELKGVKTGKGNLYAEKILVAPGRVRARWFQDLCSKYGIEYIYDMVEVGVRVEFPSGVMKRYAESLYEIVLKVRTNTFDDIVRTFCSCPNGYVAREDYQGYVCVNGYSNSDHLSKNSNFALVCEVNLTEPVENSIAYAQSVAELASTIGGQKPVLQRLADLRKGRRSTWRKIEKSLVTPSLTDVTPGDISMALPHRIVVNILESLERLDSVMPGINSGSTLLYAPEVKFRSSKIKTNPSMETSLKGLFVAGDASGMAGSITGAAATGIMAARGILELR